MVFDSLTGHGAALPASPLAGLSVEDFDLVIQFVLKSGSIKDLASVYGVSYPTIRARLDRVIARLEGVIAGRPPDPLTELLADLVERGELSPANARAVRDAARRASEKGGAS